MNTATLNRDCLHQQHDEIRSTLQRLHSVFHGVVQAPQEIKAILDGFEQTLVNHFAYEEFDGCFPSLVRQAPHLELEADRLVAEHHLLRHLLADLSDFAASGNGTTPWWRELALRCHVLSEKLVRHEAAENVLMQRAAQSAAMR